jgi:hypothetical protein
MAGGIIRDAREGAALTFSIPPPRTSGAPLVLRDNLLVCAEPERRTCAQLGRRLLPSELIAALGSTDKAPSEDTHHRVQIAARG